MIRQMSSVKVEDRFTHSELRERLGMGYIISDTATWVKMVRACFKKVRE